LQRVGGFAAVRVRAAAKRRAYIFVDIYKRRTLARCTAARGGADIDADGVPSAVFRGVSNDLQANPLIGQHVLVGDSIACVVEQRRLGGGDLLVAAADWAAGRIAALSWLESHG
jgi:hypothetical protein